MAFVNCPGEVTVITILVLVGFGWLLYCILFYLQGLYDLYLVLTSLSHPVTENA